MFGRHRKARVLFGLSDVLLAALAFEAAYQTRVLLHLERAFYLNVEGTGTRLCTGSVGHDRSLARSL